MLNVFTLQKNIQDVSYLDVLSEFYVLSHFTMLTVQTEKKCLEMKHSVSASTSRTSNTYYAVLNTYVR